MQACKSYILFTFVLLCAAIQLRDARAQACNLDGKQVDFSGRYCLRGNCYVLHQKLQFVGDKVLWFADANAGDAKTTFQLGRAVDLKLADPSFRESGPPGSTQNATASATQQGPALILTIDIQWRQQSAMVGHAWRKMVLEVNDCSSCTITYEFSGVVPTGNFKTTFDQYYCRIGTR